MKVNERGSTLVLVLIVILVFSILGVSLMGNAVSERKRVDVTEADTQARVLAQSGLDYFETQFKTFAKDREFTFDELKTYFQDYNAATGIMPEGITLLVEWDGFDEIVVTSKGTEGSNEKDLVGHYRLGFDIDIDTPSREIADFNDANTEAVNFSNDSLLGLGLGPVLNLDLVQANLPDSLDDETFYVVPDDYPLIQVQADLLGLIKIADINFGDFTMYKNKKYIAVRKDSLLGVKLLNNLETKRGAVEVNLLNYTTDKNVNVLINGYTEYFNLLGLDGLLKLLKFLHLDELLHLDKVLELVGELTTISGHKDIDFGKFAVFGNVIIQQNKGGILGIGNDNAGKRCFVFDEGLYVSKSIIIGGKQKSSSQISKLLLRGDMVAKGELPKEQAPTEPNTALVISHVDLEIGDYHEHENKKVSNFYSHGDVLIKNANIRMKNDKYDFGVLTKDKMTIEECGSLNGLFYAEDGIEIKTNGKDLHINGALIGGYTVDDPSKLHYNIDYKYLDKLTNVTLTLKEGK